MKFQGESEKEPIIRKVSEQNIRLDITNISSVQDEQIITSNSKIK